MDFQDLISILIPLAVVGIIVLVFIVPQQQQKKQEKRFLKNCKVGDNIVTIGGIHATIVDKQGTRFLLEGETSSTLFWIDRQAISIEATKAYYAPPSQK